MVPQDIKTDGTVGVDIGVIDLGREADLGRLEGIIDWERDGEEKDTAGIRRLPLAAAKIRTRITWVETARTHWTHNGGLPLEHVVSGRTGTARGRWVTSEINQFLVSQSR